MLNCVNYYVLISFFSPKSFKLNEHHNALVLNYLRFAKFQRGQCIKSIKNLFEDAKDTK